MLLKQHPHYRTDVLTQERVVIRKTTNYVVGVEIKSIFGHTWHHHDHCHDDQAKETLYWGEYPLYFAACLGQEESYRLILARFVKSFAKDLQICAQLLLGPAHICKSAANKGVFWRKGIYVSYISIVLLVGTIVTLGLTFEISVFLCHSCRGADPDSLDTNGNNICHMMVILNKVRIFLNSYSFAMTTVKTNLSEHFFLLLLTSFPDGHV